MRIVGTEGSLEAAMERGVLTIIRADEVSELTKFEARQPYYPPILSCLPKPGSAGPTEETCRSFMLTHVGLCARDAADRMEVVANLDGPWD